MKKPGLLLSILVLAVAAASLPRALAASQNRLAEPPAAHRTYLPAVPHWNTVWDQRLTLRGAAVTPAAPAPGEGYWKLVKAVWYAEEEEPFAGQHHIFIDALDPDRGRQPGVWFEVASLDGSTIYATLYTETKPADPYAANFPMYALAPAYRVAPSDGNPADVVSGLGLGNIEYPYLAYHTSYGLVWQWTVAPAATETPTSTPTLTETPVMEGVRP